jgi:hypothetical protein
MAPARHTSERRGQKINAPHDSTLQGNCSHRTRRRATPETTFFVFIFHLPRFHHFTANVTRALPLEAIKGEAWARVREREGDQEKKETKRPSNNN